MDTYDIIIVGAGPAGIFAARELTKRSPGTRVLLIEKGNRIEERTCPKRQHDRCWSCQPCNITTGFSGAGAFSDGKLLLSGDVGGGLGEYVDRDTLAGLNTYVDAVYLANGADTRVYGRGSDDVITQLRQKAIESNLKMIECPIRHIGTEKCAEIYANLQRELIEDGVTILFKNPVKDIIVENGAVAGVIADREYRANRVILAVGREGASWLKELCARHGIPTRVGGIDIGVRVEVRNEIMQEINDAVYESKLVYYSATFDDRVRTFCQNPAGIVATEYYEDGLAVVNGHSYKSDEFKTENTNFAILVSNYFTQPFKEPIEYGKYIARLGNLLSGNKIIVQRYGDFRRGRRTTVTRLSRNNITPTLKDAVPGDLSLVLPYRIMLDIKEMIEALNNIFPGLSSDETLLYGIEVKFYSNIVETGSDFRTGLAGLFVAGDGAGITRSLMQASINGVLAARAIIA